MHIAMMSEIGLLLATEVHTRHQDHFRVQNLQGCHSAFPQKLVICWSWRWLHSMMLSCITNGVVCSVGMLALLLHALFSQCKQTTVLPVVQIKSIQQLA
jgi:hypothetical protein